MSFVNCKVLSTTLPGPLPIPTITIFVQAISSFYLFKTPTEVFANILLTSERSEEVPFFDEVFGQVAYRVTAIRGFLSSKLS